PRGGTRKPARTASGHQPAHPSISCVAGAYTAGTEVAGDDTCPTRDPGPLDNTADPIRTTPQLSPASDFDLFRSRPGHLFRSDDLVELLGGQHAGAVLERRGELHLLLA